MKKIIVTVSTGYVGSRRECEIEVENDATEKEIEEEALEAMYEMIDWNWYKKDNKC